MPTINYIEHDGTTHSITAEAGKSVMEIAVDHMIPGIIAECGGCCTCGTCHGYVDAAWRDKLSPQSADEAMVLEGIMRAEAGSRLMCQICVEPKLDGIVIRLPERQF